MDIKELLKANKTKIKQLNSEIEKIDEQVDKLDMEIKEIEREKDKQVREKKMLKLKLLERKSLILKEIYDVNIKIEDLKGEL
jgi:septal ring factor EnvC (AmiA/AmiB activator)